MYSRPTNSLNIGDAVDALWEQMRSVIAGGDLTSPPAAATADLRTRGSSPSNPLVTARPDTQMENPIARSRDGLNWLPLPFQQSRIYDRGSPVGAIRPDQENGSPPPGAHECTSTDCAVVRTFVIPELLELILKNLSVQDVIELRRTNRNFNSAVVQSPQLRLYRFWYPQWNRPSRKFLLLSPNLPGLTISLGARIPRGHYVVIKMTREVASRIHTPQPKLGAPLRFVNQGQRGGPGNNPSTKARPKVPLLGIGKVRYQDLHITQPPTVKLQAFVTTSNNVKWDAAQLPPGLNVTALANLQCDAGITLGFLAETALSLISEDSVSSNETENVEAVFRFIVAFVPPESAPRRRLGARRVIRLV